MPTKAQGRTNLHSDSRRQGVIKYRNGTGFAWEAASPPSAMGTPGPGGAPQATGLGEVWLLGSLATRPLLLLRPLTSQLMAPENEPRTAGPWGPNPMTSQGARRRSSWGGGQINRT